MSFALTVRIETLASRRRVGRSAAPGVSGARDRYPAQDCRVSAPLEEARFAGMITAAAAGRR
jgi:hypothetical protein